MKLDGIRVLDLTRFLPGPYAAMMMADHGADVIKVESPEGEPTRGIGPSVGGQTVYFRNTQRGKRSCVIDLKSDAGKADFLALAAIADVLIESFRPGVARRLGIDQETLRARFPRLVYCSLSAFGQTGELAARPSHDMGAQAITGVLSLSRGPDGRPAIPALPVADISLALSALSGVLMALLRRHTTGRGDYLDIAMADTLATWAAPIAHDVFGARTPPDLGRERLYGGAAFYDIYECADGKHIVLSGSEIAFAEALLTALGRPDLIALCRLPAGPGQNPVRAFLAETFRTRTRDTWERDLAGLNVCFAPVNDLAEGLQLPQLRARKTVLDGPDGTLRFGVPIHFADEPGHAAERGPDLGEHTDAVLAEARSGALRR
jgi:crotonobetainyl-CoA:carnitine CoA-transferase CaiB-like acyl-CoA transferase